MFLKYSRLFRHMWSQGPAPTKIFDNPSPTDQPRLNIPTTHVPRPKAHDVFRRGKRTRHRRGQSLSLWSCMSSGCIEQSGVAGRQWHFQGLALAAWTWALLQGQFAFQQVKGLIKTLRSHVLYNATTVNALSHAGPVMCALDMIWLRMALIGRLTCWSANCRCRSAHAHAAQATPWKCHWQATPDCSMQPFDLHDQIDRD